MHKIHLIEDWTELMRLLKKIIRFKITKLKQRKTKMGKIKKIRLIKNMVKKSNVKYNGLTAEEIYHWQEAVVEDIAADRHICKDQRYQATNEYEINLR